MNGQIDENFSVVTRSLNRHTLVKFKSRLITNEKQKEENGV